MHAEHSCKYCDLPFVGPGYSPDAKRHYCCYGCYLVERIIGSQGEEGIAAAILLRLGVGAFLSMNVMMISIVLYVNSADLSASLIRTMHWALLILSTPAMAILSGPFVVGGFNDLRRKRVGTDVLIATGSLAAFFVSAANAIRGTGPVYFDTATMLLLIVTVGRLLEASAKNRTSRSIRELIELTPETARVLRGETEVEVPSSEVCKGDVMIVRPGERIAADGRIVSGSCLVEEAAFTGEARPRSCAVGDSVFGGSVNCDGLIIVEATAVGSGSLLAQIQEMVRRAQRERAPVERLAERMASAFVPVVWLTALAAGAYWGFVRGDVERAGLSALAVLVVACPCALGLATSMATCLAIGKAARAGVLIRSGEILERLPRVRTIFFDKTGTLTLNRLSVADVHVTANGPTPDEILAWAAPLEAASEHSIAKAIVDEAQARGLRLGSVTDFRVFPGLGVEGMVSLDGESLLVTAGSLKLLSERHLIPEDLVVGCDLTATYVGWGGRAQAVISLSDTTRPEARQVISELGGLGLRTAVVSGDRDGPARRLAAEVGIEEVFSECTPADKAALVRKMRVSVGGVAMVGDGINDAPALAEADVGIATGGGTDLARQSSDVTLLGDDLTRIPWTLDLSRLTYRIIRQNLFWAFGYNSVAMCLAFLGFVHPLIAAAAMLLSSLFVIANSMRLLR